MLECNLITLAENSLIDSDSSLLSLIKLIEKLQATPNIKIPLEVCAFISNFADSGPATLKFVYGIYDKDGALVSKSDVVTIDRTAHNIRLRFFGFRTPSTDGVYFIRLLNITNEKEPVNLGPSYWRFEFSPIKNVA